MAMKSRETRKVHLNYFTCSAFFLKNFWKIKNIVTKVYVPCCGCDSNRSAETEYKWMDIYSCHCAIKDLNSFAWLMENHSQPGVGSTLAVNRGLNMEFSKYLQYFFGC